VDPKTPADPRFDLGPMCRSSKKQTKFENKKANDFKETFVKL